MRSSTLGSATWFFGLVIGFLLSPASAQGPPPAGTPSGGSVHGSIVSAETLQPLATASVSLHETDQSPAIAGELTDEAGRFRIAGLATGRYVVRVRLLGYEDAQREVEIADAATAVDLGRIELASAAITMEEIAVETERPPVITAPDRTIYSTSDMPVAAGGMATDVLRNVPELEVDIDGSVELRGESPAIYLNGRPAPMDGEALAVFLEQFPADRIDRIEVIPNPSARFEADGSGGIVNIVLKENLDLGLSGSIFLNGGTRGDLGGGSRLAYQRGRLTLFGGGFGRHTSRDDTNYDLRQNLLADPVTFLEQQGSSSRDGLSGSVDLTAEWKLSEQGTLWSEGRFFHNGFDTDGSTVYTRMDAGQQPFEQYDRLSVNESRRQTARLATGYRHVLEPRRHLVELRLEYDLRDGRHWSRAEERDLTQFGSEPASFPRLVLDESLDDRTRLRFDADYTRPLGESSQLEVGYRAQVDDRDTDRAFELDPGDSGSTGVHEQRGYGFREAFHSAYATFVGNRGPLRVQLGLRGERVDASLQVPGHGTVVDNQYDGLFPSANLSYDLGGGREARISYSQRIRRPRPNVLNPIDQSTDPLNRRIGNPDIDPQYTHSFSVETSWSGRTGTLRFSPYFRRTEDRWERFRSVDAEGVSTLTWHNLSTVDRLGSTLTASLRPVRGIGGFASVSGFRESRDASNLPTDLSGTSMRWSARGNLSARLNPTTSLQAMVSYRPARDLPQGRLSSSVMTSVGLRQQLWDRRVSLNLMTTDPFDLYRSSFETRDPTHVQIGSSRMTMRRAVLSLSYAFGRPPRDARQRESGEMEDEALEPDIR